MRESPLTLMPFGPRRKDHDRVRLPTFRMYTLGELGISLGLAWLVFFRFRERVDFRLVLLGGILPDLIDKPLGAVLGLEARLWAHTLLFLAILTLLSRLPTLRALQWVAFGDAVHLLVDLMWEQPNVALWPAFGWGFPPGTQSLAGYFQILLTNPYVQFGEIVGAAILVAAALHYGMTSWTRLKAFLSDGRLVRRTPG